MSFKLINNLKVGIAGYGVVGKRRRECIDTHPSMDIVAICDRSFANSGVMEDGVRYYKNYKQLLEEKLDILIICLTNDIAAEVTIAGLESGLHVFCEKPPGRNMEDIKNVIEVEKKYSELKLMYGFNHRYHDSVIDALNIIKSKQLGSIINLRGVYGKSQLITFNQPDWRTKRDIAGGGVLLDQGIHMVDLMRLLAGKFVDIHSFISNNYWGHDVEDNAYAIMRTKEGVVAMLNSSATQWKHRFDLEICLEKGSLTLGGILSGSKSYGEETLTIVYANPENDLGNPKQLTTKYNDDPSWYSEISEFANCVIKNRKITSGTSDDALQTMEIVYKIYYQDKEWRQNYNISNPYIL
jgi:predicted dehydrogenase